MSLNNKNMYDITRHKTTETEKCKGLNVFKHHAAFTLAEVLITLAVIGVVAVLTLPNLIQNHNEKSWATAQSVFEKRLEIATKQMNTEEKLAGYANTMDFVNELKKYIKIIRICDRNEISKCFADTIIWKKGDDPIDISQINSSKNLGHSDWNTEAIGVQFANGINAIIAYNPNTTQEPFNNQFEATQSSMAILYDISGDKLPNTNGQDLSSINVTNLIGNLSCTIKLSNDLCLSEPFAPPKLSEAQCNELVNQGYPIPGCQVENDTWAGTIQYCHDLGTRPPTRDELLLLANELYDKHIPANPIFVDANWDEEKAKNWGFDTSSGAFYIWSNEPSSPQANAYVFRYHYNYVHTQSLVRAANTQSVCVIP